MKTKTTKSANQDDFLDIEKIATEMAASAVAPADSATTEAKTAKVPKKKVAKPAVEAGFDDTAAEIVAEGVADHVGRDEHVAAREAVDELARDDLGRLALIRALDLRRDRRLALVLLDEAGREDRGREVAADPDLVREQLVAQRFGEP